MVKQQLLNPILMPTYVQLGQVFHIGLFQSCLMSLGLQLLTECLSLDAETSQTIIHGV